MSTTSLIVYTLLFGALGIYCLRATNSPKLLELDAQRADVVRMSAMGAAVVSLVLAVLCVIALILQG